MLSSLSSYIWGSAEEEAQQQQAVVEPPHGTPIPAVPAPARAKPSASRQGSQEEEDWVLVGSGVAKNAALTLGSLNEINPRPSTGSTGSSNEPSEQGEEEDTEPSDAQDVVPSAGGRPVNLTRSQRRLLTPFSGCLASTLPQRKAARAAQSSKQKRASKTNTAKATERGNKAVKYAGSASCSKKQGASRHNLAIKASGSFSKGLKQC